MKQIVQDFRKGRLRLVDVPAPVLRAGGVLVDTQCSAISIGTERSKVELAQKSLIGKARARPDQVRQVLDTISREGVLNTYRKVRTKLDALNPMGYSSAGHIIAVGDGVTDLAIGQRVACAGAGYANHAEISWVPSNLVVPVPDEVQLEEAAFATIAAIALQGVRQSETRLGETVAVIGLGLLGQITVQLLRAAGVRVIGIDVNEARVAMAEKFGAMPVPRSTDVQGHVRMITGGIGCDAVLITAATSSEDPIRLAGAISRDRGRVVIVGDVPINVPRSPYYEKEVDVRLSRSYGPGRYDPNYEERGIDYPVGYVRWTERRNLGEVLNLIRDGSLSLAALITHRYAFSDAESAYESLTGPEGARALGVVLSYENGVSSNGTNGRIQLRAPSARVARDRVRLGVIGAGSFASGTLLPRLKTLPVELVGVVTATGLSARTVGEQLGFQYMAGSAEEILGDESINAVLIATRHDEHARLSAQALRAGKAVFVEKPLALDDEALDEVLAAAAETTRLLTVGFNRRFAPATEFVRQRLAKVPGARVIHIRVNAGFLKPEHWLHDPKAGGGRILGEGCHFIDLGLSFTSGYPLEVTATTLGAPDPDAALNDNVQISVRCSDGSLVSVLYTSKGSGKAGKERIEIFAGGTTSVIDDFRKAEFWGTNGKQDRWSGTQDKGHGAELEAFVKALLEGGAPPIELTELEASSRATLRAADSIRSGMPEPVGSSIVAIHDAS